MISIVICTYNGEKFLKKQLMSIVNQTIIPDEIVVCDDCSTDGTIDIINEFRYEYNNIHWNVVVNDVNVGFANNFFSALYLARGDYIFLSDQDDIWNRKKIEKMSQIMKTNTNIGILFSSYCCIDKNDNFLHFKYRVNNSFKFLFFNKLFKIKKYSFNDFIRSMNVAGMSMCIKKNILNDFLKLRINKLKYHDLFLALFASINDKLYFYNYNLVDYRMHKSNAIGLNSAKGKIEDRKSWLKHNLNDQMLMKQFMVDNKIYNKCIKKLDDLIVFNNKRYEILDKKSIKAVLKNIINLKMYPSLSSYLGDIKYIWEMKNEENS